MPNSDPVKYTPVPYKKDYTRIVAKVTFEECADYIIRNFGES